MSTGAANRKRILVAVDGSVHALAAVEYLARTLPAGDVEVDLFHVLTRIPESFWDLQNEPAYHYRIADVREWEAQQEKAIQEFMERASTLLRSAGFPHDSVKVVLKDRRAGIARDIIEASQQGYNSVAVGRRGLSELKDLVLGSTANKLVEKLVHVPVLIAGSAQQRGKVLVALDASEGALAAVDYVADMLKGASRWQVTLLHVIRGFNIFHQVVGRGSDVETGGGWMDRMQSAFEEAAKGIEPVFAEARERLMESGLDGRQIDRKVIKGASTRAGAIVEEAQRGGYDTIVVGRRGLSRVQEFFMGRVSNKVIQLAKDQTVWVVN